MRTNAVVLVALLVVVCGFVGVSSQAQLTGTATQRGTGAEVAETGFGDDVSAFMQRGIVAANGSVDTGLWLAAFETADNLSRKQALVHQRAATLETRIDRLETRIEEFPPANATPLALRAQRVRLVAERDALREAVSGTTTTAASEGVNATKLDELGSRVENLTVAPVGSNDSTAGVTATADSGTPSVNREGPRPAVNRQQPGATYSGP